MVVASPCPQIGILGMGAVGQFLGLALAPHADVCWFVRKDIPQAPSLTVLGYKNWSIKNPRCASLGSPEASQVAARLTMLLVCVREHQLGSILQGLGNLPDSLPLVFAQNGLGILELAEQAGLPRPERLYRMVCRFGVMREGAWATRLSGPFGVTIAPRDPIAESLAALLSKAEFQVSFAASVKEAEWQKALLNIFVNPMCTLAGQANRALLEDASLRASALGLVKEAAAVSKSEGVDLSSWTEEKLTSAISPFKDNVNSLLVGLRAGLPSDMDMLLGEVERRAARHGIEVPRIHHINQKLTALFSARP